ncbi:MAG: hypothetical protein ABTQ29_10380 [Siculibacillus sp.]
MEPGAEAEPRIVRLDMALTFAELLRLAPHLDHDGPLDVGERSVSAALSGGRWRLTLGAQSERVIALLRLPRAEMEIRLDGFAPARAEAFLARFHRVFQKGGG